MQITRFSHARPFCLFSDSLLRLIDKKVNRIALNWFEKIVHAIFYCVSPTYRSLYRAKINLIPSIPVSEDLNKKIDQAERQVAVEGHHYSISDKIAGCLLGQAIGDALGLLTEFETKENATQLLNNKELGHDLRFDPAFTQGQTGKRLAPFPPGWTDDTDQCILGIRAKWLKKHDPRYEHLRLSQIFAEQLNHWFHHGLDGFNRMFLSRAHPAPNGIGRLVQAVVRHPHFIDAPERAAYESWTNPNLSMGRQIRDRPAPNGALMRTSFVGAANYKTISGVVEDARIFCKTTHADPRATASCVTLSVAIALCIRGCKNIDTIIYHASAIGKQVLTDELSILAQGENLRTYLNEFDEYMNVDRWEKLRLDDQSSIGYTYKCLGAAFMALKIASRILQSPEHAASCFSLPLRAVISQGGDADTNAAVAGALMGAYLGQDHIPTRWIENLPDRDVLDHAIHGQMPMITGRCMPNGRFIY